MNSGKIIRRSKALKLIADLQSIHAQNKKVGITQDSDLSLWLKACVRELRKLDTKIQQQNATLRKLKSAKS